MAVGEGELYYWTYLDLDRLLDCQHLESAKHGATAHDELLFVIVHQAYELWFKQILWELDAVITVVGREPVPESEMGQVVTRLERIVAIQPLLLRQLEVLETMTPLDFLDFRDYLIPASGFQSVQFRMIENRLGLDPARRMKIKGASYTAALRADHEALLRRTETEPTLLDEVNRWLARTPFLRFGAFDFWHAYRQAVEEMLARDRKVIETNPNLGETARAEQLESFEQTVETFAVLFERERWEDLRRQHKRLLSHEAMLAALLISLYRDEPIFQVPHRLLTALIEIDEGFAAWRQRHALVVHRMIGGKIGTGGTTGVRYLEATVDKHRIFRDLFDLPTFFIPRSALPVLPPEVREQMGFRYTGPAG